MDFVKLFVVSRQIKNDFIPSFVKPFFDVTQKNNEMKVSDKVIKHGNFHCFYKQKFQS